MIEYDNTYVIDLTIANANISVMVTLHNLRTKLSDYIHNHVENELLYVLSGRATLEYGNTKKLLQQFQVCLIPAGIYHYITDRSDDLQITSLRFALKLRNTNSSKEIQQIMQYLSLGEPKIFVEQDIGFYQELWDIFLNDTIRPPIFYQERLKAETVLLFCHLFDQIILSINFNIPTMNSAPSISKEQNTVELLEHILSEKYMQQLTLNDVAREINMSRSGTQRLIKSLYGIGFSKKKIETRLIAAHSLIQDSNLTLREIAEKCGYNSYDNFSKSFKRMYGMSPELLRKTR